MNLTPFISGIFNGFLIFRGKTYSPKELPKFRAPQFSLLNLIITEKRDHNEALAQILIHYLVLSRQFNRLKTQTSNPTASKGRQLLVITFIKMKVRPEKRKELSQTLHSIVGQVRKEKGCVHSGFYQDVESENDFLMVGEWQTQEDLDDHLGSDIFTVLLGAGSLMIQPPEIVVTRLTARRN